MDRFGQVSLEQIDGLLLLKGETEPLNTRKTKRSVWKQFTHFCANKQYVLDGSASNENIALILKDWAYNMRKLNGDEYKEKVVKTIWNITAKLIQEKYIKEYKREINIFMDPIFKQSRDARNAKRRILKSIPEKRTRSAAALKSEEFQAMLNVWNEETPEGLQIKFFLIASVQLAWRGGEGTSCLLPYFQEELGTDGIPTGRLEYNPKFTRTTQDEDYKWPQSKWLTPNSYTEKHCVVRLFKKFVAKRHTNITTDRMFLTVNPAWNTANGNSWYKNMPAGRREMAKWTKKSAQLAGVDVTNQKITNQSNRATAVSNMAKVGIADEQLINIGRQGSVRSMTMYLQLDQQNPQNIFNQIRNSQAIEVESNQELLNQSNKSTIQKDPEVIYPEQEEQFDDDSYSLNSIKIEPTNENENANENDLITENGFENKDYENNAYENNDELVQLQLENEHLKRKLMLEQHARTMNLIEIQYNNELLKAKLLKQKLANFS